MIFGNGLKQFDFARQNLDGRAKCLAQKNEEKTLDQSFRNHYCCKSQTTPSKACEVP